MSMSAEIFLKQSLPKFEPQRAYSKYFKLAFVFLLAAISSAQVSTPQSQNIPVIQEKALDGSIVNLPDKNSKKPMLFIIGFSHKSETQCDNWNQKLKSTYMHNPKIAYFEMADFQGVPHWVMAMISHGLHRKIPKDEQAYFIPFFNHEDEWKKLTGYAAPEDAYLIVANSDGLVSWQTHGAFTDAHYAELQAAVQKQIAAN